MAYNLELTDFQGEVLKQINMDTLEWIMGDGSLSDDEDDALAEIVTKIRQMEKINGI